MHHERPIVVNLRLTAHQYRLLQHAAKDLGCSLQHVLDRAIEYQILAESARHEHT